MITTDLAYHPVVSTLNAVYTAVQARRLPEAQALLDDCTGRDDSAAWWQMQGFIHAVQGRSALAEQAFTHGLTLSGTDLWTAGRLHVELGVLHGKAGRRDDAVKAYLLARALMRRTRDSLGLQSLAYGLAWSLLESNQVQEAATVLDKSVIASGRAGGRSYRSLVQCGRSLVARLQGDQRLALSRAQLARSTAVNATLEARARYLEGQAHWRLGQLQEAEQSFAAAADLTPEAAEMALSHAGDMAGMDDCEKMGQQPGKHDCPCCDTGKACPPELCLTKCFKLIGTVDLPKAARVMASMSLRPVDPDRPPDRSYAPQPPPPRT